MTSTDLQAAGQHYGIAPTTMRDALTIAGLLGHLFKFQNQLNRHWYLGARDNPVLRGPCKFLRSEMQAGEPPSARALGAGNTGSGGHFRCFRRVLHACIVARQRLEEAVNLADRELPWLFGAVGKVNPIAFVVAVTAEIPRRTLSQLAASRKKCGIDPPAPQRRTHPAGIARRETCSPCTRTGASDRRGRPNVFLDCNQLDAAS